VYFKHIYLLKNGVLIYFWKTLISNVLIALSKLQHPYGTKGSNRPLSLELPTKRNPFERYETTRPRRFDGDRNQTRDMINFLLI